MTLQPVADEVVESIVDEVLIPLVRQPSPDDPKIREGRSFVRRTK